MTAVTSAVRSVAGRAVHIKIHPRPRTITESREILSVLERYGEVVMYKSLKYEPQSPAPNSALAIYRSADGASRAMSASPIRFTFGQASEVRELGTTFPLQPEPSTIPEPEAMSSLSTDQDTQMDMSREARAAQLKGVEDARVTLEAEAQRIRELVKGEREGSADFQKRDEDEKWGTTFMNYKSPQKPLASPTQPTTPPAPAFSLPTTRFPSSSSQKASPTFTSPSSASSDTPFNDPNLPTPCEVSLIVTPSALSHSAYIARQAYYGHYKPDTKSMMALDLQKRLPPGLSPLMDTKLNAHEAYLRVRMRQQKRATGEKAEWSVGPLRSLMRQAEVEGVKG